MVQFSIFLFYIQGCIWIRIGLTDLWIPDSPAPIGLSKMYGSFYEILNALISLNEIENQISIQILTIVCRDKQARH